MLDVWYDNFFDAGNKAVLPYANDLARFTAYLQQRRWSPTASR